MSVIKLSIVVIRLEAFSYVWFLMSMYYNSVVFIYLPLENLQESLSLLEQPFTFLVLLLFADVSKDFPWFVTSHKSSCHYLLHPKLMWCLPATAQLVSYQSSNVDIEASNQDDVLHTKHIDFTVSCLCCTVLAITRDTNRIYSYQQECLHTLLLSTITPPIVMNRINRVV